MSFTVTTMTVLMVVAAAAASPRPISISASVSSSVAGGSVVAESKTTGPDGATKGECVFMKDGVTTKVGHSKL